MTPLRTRSLVVAASLIALTAGAGMAASGADPATNHGTAAASGGEALAVITSNNQVELARLNFHRQPIVPILIGPVTNPSLTQLVTVDSLVSSPDGDWLAWDEALESKQVVNGIHPYIRNVVVLRNERTGHRSTVAGHSQTPLGFVGDTLITAGSPGGAKRFVLKPSPHLVSLHDHSELHSTYRHGVVDVAVPHSKRIIERLRLTSLSGKHVVLHDYPETPSERSVGVTSVSGDGDWLAVERGDHTDFGGVGPSSIVDLFRLTGSRPRTQLGHIGTAKAGWRIATMSFGANDEVWAAWYRAASPVQTRLTRYVHGKWKTVDTGVITVAGNTKTGDVVYQRGRYKPVPSEIQFVPATSGNAVIIHRGHAQRLGIAGLEFAWAAR